MAQKTLFLFHEIEEVVYYSRHSTKLGKWENVVDSCEQTYLRWPRKPKDWDEHVKSTYKESGPPKWANFQYDTPAS